MTLGAPISIQQGGGNPAGTATPTSATTDIQGAPATLATLQGLIQSNDPTAIAQITKFAGTLGEDVSALAQAYPANTSLASYATAAKGQAESIVNLLLQTPAGTPITGNSGTLITTALTAAVTASQKTLAAYWGSVLTAHVTANGCPVETGLVNLFQLSYNAAGFSQTIPVTNVYDAATQAALNEVSPGQGVPCPASTVVPAPAPAPGQTVPPAIVVVNPQAAAAAPAPTNVPLVIGAVAAVGVVGWFVYATMFAKAASAALENPISRLVWRRPSGAGRGSETTQAILPGGSGYIIEPEGRGYSLTFFTSAPHRYVPLGQSRTLEGAKNAARRHSDPPKMSYENPRRRSRRNPVEFITGESAYLLEAKWFSPSTNTFHHYATIEVFASSLRDAYAKAREVMIRNRIPFRIGDEPMVIAQSRAVGRSERILR
jgi:hypothetical protein